MLFYQVTLYPGEEKKTQREFLIEKRRKHFKIDCNVKSHHSYHLVCRLCLMNKYALPAFLTPGVNFTYLVFQFILTVAKQPRVVYKVP